MQGFYKELCLETNTDWDFSLENMDSYETYMAVPWFLRPSTDILRGLFDTSDKVLSSRTQAASKLALDVDEFTPKKYFQHFNIGKEIKSTRDIVDGVNKWCSLIELFSTEFKSIHNTIKAQAGSKEWEDNHPEHYKKLIELVGEGVGERTLTRRSFLGAYSIVVLTGSDLKFSSASSIKNDAGKTNLIKALDRLERAHATLWIMKGSVKDAIVIATKEANKFKALKPNNFKIINKYYAACINPYVSLVKYNNTIYTQYLNFLESL